MGDENGSSGGALPVRAVEMLDRDGRRTFALRVFCPRHHHSMDPAACVACPFVSSVSRHGVVCRAPGAVAAPPDASAPLYLGPQASALRTPIGAVCSARVVAVRKGLSEEQVRSALDGAPYVVVLGEGDRVCGIVSNALSSQRSGRMGVDDDSRQATLEESAPLRDAIERMVRGELRVLPVVDAVGRFVGTVTDLDILRWVSHQHR
jgi:hypothetical protein